MKKNNSKPLIHTKSWYESFSLILILFFIAVIPLLIRVTMVHYPMDQFSWYSSETVYFDSFSLFKSYAIVVSGFFSLLLLVKKGVVDKCINWKDPVILITVAMMSITLLSHIFSTNTYVSNRGFLHRYEGVWTWLSYFSMFLLVYSHPWTDKNKKYFIRAFVLSNYLLCVIGIFQYFGINIIINELTKPFITALNMKNIPYTANYIVEYKTIVQTLYHYNYVAYYISMSFPFIVSLLLHEKGIKNKLAYGILSILILLNLFGSTARSGLISLILIAPLFIWINRHLLFKRKWTFPVLTASLIILFVGFEFFSNGFITMRLKSITAYQPIQTSIQSINIHDNVIDMSINEDQLEIIVLNHNSESWEVAYKLNGEQVFPIGFDESGKLYFDHEKLLSLRSNLSKTDTDIFLAIGYEGTTWQFGYQNEQLEYVNPYNKFDVISKPESIGFKGYETLGSARGYIWSRSLPIILDKPLLGHGPDTFATVFPQSDYLGKMTAYGTNNMIVDKPHNQYIQMAINSGIIYLIGFISYLLILVRRSYKDLKTTQFKAYNTMQSATLCAIISYYIAAFFNDSTVHVSPVFWTLLALSLVTFKSKQTEIL